ncbi:MAG: response regulator [Planctomycetia bacterium]|nr:response regulator [Planctomycetia bacterium]
MTVLDGQAIARLGSAPNYSERVLVLTPPGGEAGLIEDVLRRDGLPRCRLANLSALCAEFTRGAGAAVIAEEMLTPPVMQQLAETLGRQGEWSDFPLLILFGEVGRSPDVAARMLNLLEPLGNVAILERPVTPTALIGALRAALRGRRRQYQVRDLLAQRERDLERRQQFLSLLAHEVRNPLGAIQQATEILKRLGAPTNQAVEQRTIISRQTARLARLIDNLLDVSQLLLGNLKLRAAPTDLRDIVREALQGLRGELDGQPVPLAYQQSPEPLPVSAEAARLARSLQDILTAALLLAAPGSQFQLRLSRQEREAVLQLSSSDRQLAPALAARLLDPGPENGELLPADAQPALRVALGLAGKVLELHGGVVSLLHEQPGGGTLALRFSLLEGAPSSTAETVPTPLPGAPSRVLIVEDNVDARDSMQLLVQLWGHRVQTASTAEQGIQRALRERPDVALVDIGLPDADGYEVARRLRAAFGPNILLLAMTGFGPPHDSPRAQEAGFDLHLVKPVDPRALYALLRNPHVVRLGS